MALTMSGQSGQLRVAGRVAARLGAWSLNPDPDMTFICNADVAERNEVWMAQLGDAQPELLLDMGASRWRWRGVTVVDGGRLVISGSGKPEIL